VNTYIIFLYGSFEDYDDMEFFSMNVLGASDKIDEIKYIVQNLNNLIVILTSSTDVKILMNEITTLLDNENVNFYFVFNKKDLHLFHLPETIKDIIFKPISFMNVENKKNEYNLDELLDKIKDNGLNSLTQNEKKFLDDFGLS